MGSIGYFPTYTIGNVIAAQIKNRLESSLGRLDEIVAGRRFDELRWFLREAIHRWGSTFKPKELLVRQLGEPINPEHLVKYLAEKYLKY
jgi:carboxypeptidase Taq